MEPFVTDQPGHIQDFSRTARNRQWPAIATHDISRTDFHVEHIGQFARRVEVSAGRAVPHRSRQAPRYTQVQCLLLHWSSEDDPDLPELGALQRCFRDDYGFGTDTWAIPPHNSHLELMMRLGRLVKQYESPETLLIVYYGGNALINGSGQSEWCAAKEPNTPCVQWSAIQTFLERSSSDVLILSDCCTGDTAVAAPTGGSITETISASTWDAVMPDAKRYPFTSALIEVLHQWRLGDFSAAMLHAELVARLTHPRLTAVNGKRHVQRRSAPVHSILAADPRSPSILLARIVPSATSPPSLSPAPPQPQAAGVDPSEDIPHVMISVALEEDPGLHVNSWEQSLHAYPDLEKHVKIQGIFKSQSTLLLVSMPVKIWDLLPEDPATTFVAFIWSSNLVATKPSTTMPSTAHQVQHGSRNDDGAASSSYVSETVAAPTEPGSSLQRMLRTRHRHDGQEPTRSASATSSYQGTATPPSSQEHASARSSSPVADPERYPIREYPSVSFLNAAQRQTSVAPLAHEPEDTQHGASSPLESQRYGRPDVPEPQKFASHTERKLEEHYDAAPFPSKAQKVFLAAKLGVALWRVEAWFYHRRDEDAVTKRLVGMTTGEDRRPDGGAMDGAAVRMILPCDLDRLLHISAPEQVILFDLRSRAEFAKSHVYGAVSLRAPRRFLEVAPLEMIERVIPGDGGRDIFSKWQRARSIVFYGKGLEYMWECPAAAHVLEKLQQAGWNGRCFILKGHYREFSDSFDKYIAGARMSLAARAWVEEQELARIHYVGLMDESHLYPEWLAHVEREHQSRTQIASPKALSERAQALEALDRELTAELEADHRHLFEEALELQTLATASAFGPGELQPNCVGEEQRNRGGPGVRKNKDLPPVPTREPRNESRLRPEGEDGRQQRTEQEGDLGVDAVRTSKWQEVAQRQQTRAAQEPRGGETAMEPAGKGHHEESGKEKSNILHKVFRRS